MKPSTAAFVLVLASVSSLGFINKANAETVLLARGDDAFGQGWLFLDTAGQCRVATPRHVIENADGELLLPDLIDSYGAMHPTQSPIAAENEDLDLAFLTVGGQLAKSGCSRDRVRTTPLQPVIDGLKQAQLDVSTLTERQSISVAIRAVSRDESGGGFIAISSLEPGISFQKGMSGGTVTHNGQPIAMLFEVDSDEGIGVAMRYDLIAAQLQKLNASVEQSNLSLALVNDLVLIKGRVTEQGSGISGFLSGKTHLRVAPAPDRVVFLLDLGKRAVIEGVRIKGEGLVNGEHLIVETEQEDGRFLPGVRCMLSNDVHCGMAARRASRLKITLTGSADEILTLDALEVIEGGA
ncbi:hypothetical protein [Pseudorhizobium flavum]|uniref:hypothetical protein n=1 Tax=Pseudorhizobium flavum TaxID=1335061 RepID=UPI0037706F21